MHFTTFDINDIELTVAQSCRSLSTETRLYSDAALIYRTLETEHSTLIINNFATIYINIIHLHSVSSVNFFNSV